MAHAASSPPMDWEIDVPLLTNRHFLGGFAKAMLGAGVLVAALVSFGLAVQGAPGAIPALVGLLLAISAALFLLGLVVMAFPFRNRMRMRFTVDGDGVRIRVVDRTARAGARGSLLLGVVLGSGATAGAGVVAATQEDRTLRWSGAFRAVPEPATRSIALRNGWRTLARVYCTPEGFEPALEVVQAHMDRHGTAARCAARSPLGGHLLRTGLVVVAMTPVFLAREVLGYGMLVPWVLLCFALAAVWLVRPLAWVVLAGEATLVVLALAGGLRPGGLSGDDRALAALAVAGLAFLAWLAVAILARRVRPALEGDEAASGEA